MSLHIIPPERYPEVIGRIAPECCGAVYPLSVAKGIQSGSIFADDSRKTVLVRHCCGFAFLFGNAGETELSEIAEMMRNPAPFRRFLLLTEGRQTADRYAPQRGFVQERRLFFRYDGAAEIPAPPEAAEITAAILPQLAGSITPAFSWTEGEQFLKNGKGYCIIQDGQPAAWAFSAAVSDREMDIGVETASAYRRRGLAAKAVRAMIAYTLAQGKQPVWACHAGNTASRRLAEALGFRQCGECITVRYERRKA